MRWLGLIVFLIGFLKVRTLSWRFGKMSGRLEGLYGKALVRRCIDLDTLMKLTKTLLDVGYLFSFVSYIGDMSAFMKFEEEELGAGLINNPVAWKTWFSSLEVWQGQHLKFERLTWVRVHGVPLHLDENNVFGSIVRKVRNIVHAAQLSDEDGNLSVACIGILVNHANKIFEEVDLK
ncbi:hypothetical protein HanRHA438_Chr05g0233471 [Helianthus annuus]|nr:hypothetical protein HanRHA438_Chr05g0233471 [Helianthus annuus]